MEKKNRSTGDFLSTLTIAILFLVIILLVVFSAGSYRNGTEAKSANDNSRAVMSYVTTAVKDDQGARVEIRNDGGTKGIAIIDDEAGYERRIFAKDGKLLEEYVKEGSGVSPDNALVIGEVNSFDAAYIKKDLLRIRTDLGTSYVRIRKK
jgi:hypothetical protein